MREDVDSLDAPNWLIQDEMDKRLHGINNRWNATLLAAIALHCDEVVRAREPDIRLDRVDFFSRVFPRFREVPNYRDLFSVAGRRALASACRSRR